MSQIPLTPAQEKQLILLATKLPHFSASCLKIVQKDGSLVPFVFNRAQRYLHDRLERQKQDLGRVRAVILKGRQQGCTTYVQARYFHKVQFWSNIQAYILAHQAESTLKIYAMASKFHQNLPTAIKFPLIKDTERAMTTERGSGYSVGTAGSGQVGRGMTVQLFHGSEVAFFENADQISTGLMQTVADVPGTEMIFESTANGPGNFFYALFMGAVAGKNGFQAIFIPWYWQEEYQDPEPLQESELDTLERKYYEAFRYEGLTLHHLAWRRRKLGSFDGKLWKFQQEYPFTPEEAFVKTEGRFFDMANAYAARTRRGVQDYYKPLVIGIDQGRTGDHTVIARRRGKVILPLEVIPADDGAERDMRLAARVAKIIEQESPDLVVLDTTNEHGALDRLHELGYKKSVKGCHFGEGSFDPTRYRNKRVEMHFLFREWLEDPEAAIPDDQTFLSEMGAVPAEKETSNNVQYLEAKDKIKEVLGWSPNNLDAVLLTFAYPVRKVNMDAPAPRPKQPPQRKWTSQLTTLKGVRP